MRLHWIAGPVLLAAAGELMAQDAWIPMTTVGAPSPRMGHTAIWTGREMIVWGGEGPSGMLSDGARFDPVVNRWTPISSAGAPSPRRYHTAVWTGREMIVWGGDAGGVYPNTGARYDPVLDTWAAVSTLGAPPGRASHGAVWTGSRMIVWGGQNLTPEDTGGRYNPVADSWSPVTTTGAPIQTSSHVQVWTGLRMIVVGGSPNPGGSYDPNLDLWTTLAPFSGTLAGSPAGVWTGRELLLLASFGSGPVPGRYDPQTDTWAPIQVQSPSWAFPEAVWTGREALLVTATGPGGFIQMAYDPLLDRWRPAGGTYAPSLRVFFTMVWTGQAAIVWGGTRTGQAADVLDTGAIYFPVLTPFQETRAETGCLARATGVGGPGRALYLIPLFLMTLLLLRRRAASGRFLLPVVISLGLGSIVRADDFRVSSGPSSLPTIQENPPVQDFPDEENPWKTDWRFSSSVGVWLNGIEFEVFTTTEHLRLQSGGMAILQLGLEREIADPVFARITAEYAHGRDASITSGGLDLAARILENSVDDVDVDVDLFAGGLVSWLEVRKSGFDDFDPGFGFRAGLTGRLLVQSTWALEATVEYRDLSYRWSGDKLAGDSRVTARGAAGLLGISFRF